jgi:hypothetical protein
VLSVDEMQRAHTICDYSRLFREYRENARRDPGNRAYWNAESRRVLGLLDGLLAARNTGARQRIAHQVGMT